MTHSPRRALPLTPAPATATRVGALLLALSALTVPFGAASAPVARAPRPAAASTINEGASLFRANCAPCHGLNAQGGGRGPDLTTGRWSHGGTDADIFRTITQGVPGTEMPANGFEDTEIRAIIAYLRSLAPPRRTTVVGDPRNGAIIFRDRARCAECHMVGGSGGVLGPNLSRVGSARPVAYLIDSIREPDKDLSAGMLDPNNHYGLPLVYDTVTVVTADGRRFVGVARNEDTYSVQLMTTDQQLRFFLKKDVTRVVHERKSLMPAYPESVLGAAQLQDLLAYLQTLRAD